MATIIPMKKAEDDALNGYRNLDGPLEEIALVSDVCKTLFELEVASAKSMAERLGGDQYWRPTSNGSVDRLLFLLRDLDARIDNYKQDFYAADPEYFSLGSPGTTS